MVAHFNESTVELAALDLLRELGYSVLNGETIAPGEPAAERASFGEVLSSGEVQASDVFIGADQP